MKSKSVPGHKVAIDTYLRIEAVWEYLRTSIIAEASDTWIINGKIYKKEVVS